MTLIGCWRFTWSPTQNGIVTVANNETKNPRPDSLLGELTKTSGSRVSETKCRVEISVSRFPHKKPTDSSPLAADK